MVHPTPNGLVGHRHSALRQQILDVTQAEGEPEVEPYCLVNDLGRETIPGVADLVHPRRATRPPRTPQAQSAVTMPSGVPPHPEPVTWIARTYLERAEFQAAREWYEKALTIAREQHPRERAHALQGLATICIREGHNDLARK